MHPSTQRRRSQLIYSLKHFDTEILRFSADENASDPQLQILWVSEKNHNLLPLDLKVSAEGLYRWLRHRIIPKNRAYVNTLLAKLGLSINRPMKIIDVCRGLSLNDSYWVTREDFSGSFQKYNLYNNRFNQELALFALSGYGSNPIHSPPISSPELTTNGMLPKCWRRIQGKIVLYKGGTSGASNSGFEPYSEYYAAQLAERMGIRAISYGLSQWKGILCSTCELFTSKETAFVPVERIVPRGGMKAVGHIILSSGRSTKKLCMTCICLMR